MPAHKTVLHDGVRFSMSFVHSHLEQGDGTVTTGKIGNRATVLLHPQIDEFHVDVV